MAISEVNQSIEVVWRLESPRLIASLARYVGDIGLAEDLAQEALVAALQHWPKDGVPSKPGAWLMATAKRKGIDVARRRQRLLQKQEEIGRDLEDSESPDWAAQLDDDIGDDMLRLIFTACHPILSTEARVALTLRLLGGLTTEEIARAFLSPVPTIAQRIVRAKKTLAESEVPYEVPSGDERVERLASVLEVVYLIFNEGYTATVGDDWLRPELCSDALRLGRILAELMPEDSEVHGLVALMELQASRLGARVTENGEPILLADQDRSRWDQLLIRRGLTALARAQEPGPYVLQAAIAACHARAGDAAHTDWKLISVLYGALARLQPSPIVELNRAVAVGMAEGPAAALELVDQLQGEAALANYHLLPSVRGDLLSKLGRQDEARAEFEKAASLTRNEQERRLLLERAQG